MLISADDGSRMAQNGGARQELLLSMMVPLRCRAGPRNGCFQEASRFLNKFKEKLSQSANDYFSKRNSHQVRQDIDLERNFRELQQIDFKLQVG